jgi:hypothetical protein
LRAQNIVDFRSDREIFSQEIFRAVEYNVYGINMFIIKSAVTRLSAVRCL